MLVVQGYFFSPIFDEWKIFLDVSTKLSAFVKINSSFSHGIKSWLTKQSCLDSWNTDEASGLIIGLIRSLNCFTWAKCHAKYHFYFQILKYPWFQPGVGKYSINFHIWLNLLLQENSYKICNETGFVFSFPDKINFILGPTFSSACGLIILLFLMQKDFMKLITLCMVVGQNPSRTEPPSKNPPSDKKKTDKTPPGQTPQDIILPG